VFDDEDERVEELARRFPNLLVDEMDDGSDFEDEDDGEQRPNRAPAKQRPDPTYVERWALDCLDAIKTRAGQSNWLAAVQSYKASSPA
jgi:hypothetical protein